MRTLSALMLILMLAAHPAHSQASASGTDGVFLVIVPDRPVSEIEADLELLLALEERAAQQASAAGRGRHESEDNLERVKREREVAEKRFERSRRTEADKIALEAEKKALEEMKQYYERERDLRKSEEELAKSWLERSRAARAALELEGQLMESREQFRPVTGTDRFRRNQVLFELEERTLQAQKDAYDRERRVADRQKTVIERRLKLFEAREKIFDSRS